MSKIPFGAQVREKITGFTGIVTGHASYITGCDQYLVQPPNKDDDFRDPKWFDEGRLEILMRSAVEISTVQADLNGADVPAPIK